LLIDPVAPSLRRRTDFSKPKGELVVAYEGKVTESRYIEDCKRAYGAGLVKVRWLPVTGVPVTVVRSSVQERQRLLRDLMPTYDHVKSPMIDFQAIKDHFSLAYQRANELTRARAAEGDPFGCPSTTVGVLVVKYARNDSRH